MSVHRADCAAIARVDAAHRDRLIKVAWASDQSEAAYLVDIHILAEDRQGLLRDISSICTNEDIDVTGVNTASDRSNDTASMQFTVEVCDIRQLSRVLEKVEQLPDVLEVRRQV